MGKKNLENVADVIRKFTKKNKNLKLEHKTIINKTHTQNNKHTHATHANIQNKNKIKLITNIQQNTKQKHTNLTQHQSTIKR